jgi:hypothetical protein
MQKVVHCRLVRNCEVLRVRTRASRYVPIHFATVYLAQLAELVVVGVECHVLRVVQHESCLVLNKLRRLLAAFSPMAAGLVASVITEVTVE